MRVDRSLRLGQSKVRRGRDYSASRFFIAMIAFTTAADDVENALLEQGSISASTDSPEDSGCRRI
jgi:hypothetical protein